MMRRLLASLAIFAILWAPLGASDRQKSTRAPRGKSTHAKPATAKTPATRRASATSPRDVKGRMKRNAQARHAFMVRTGFPHGRPGYVIDHVVPLACGGMDAPTNMQWQTVADAKAKDRIERRAC
jgi:hypothetical protein